MMRSRIIIFLVILALILGVTFVVYSQPEPAPSFPTTPFVLYYLRQDYTVQSNSTAIITQLIPTVVWLDSCNFTEPSVVIAERNGVQPVNYNEVNLINLATTSTEPFLWWIPPWLPTGFPVNTNGNIGCIVGQTELSVQGFVRKTNVFLSLGSNKPFIAYYDANSGFLVQLEIRDGNTLSVYQLISSIGVSLGVSNYYYARVVFLCLLIPSLVIFILMLPWPWRRWSQSLLKILRQKI